MMLSMLTRESDARGEFFAGVRDTVPLILGAAPFGILFGILALTAGLPWWAAQAMSAFVFAGAAQFIAVGLLSTGTAYPFVVLTTFIVNLRHALYGASVADYLRELPRAWRVLLAFGMTDESFAMAITHFRNAQGDAAHKHWYFLGANAILFFPWQLSTALGYGIGRMLGDPLALGLDFTLPLVFIAILIPQLKTRAGIVSTLVAGLVAVLAFGMPNKFGLILSIGMGIAAGVAVERWISRS